MRTRWGMATYPNADNSTSYVVNEPPGLVKLSLIQRVHYTDTNIHMTQVNMAQARSLMLPMEYRGFLHLHQRRFCHISQPIVMTRWDF